MRPIRRVVVVLVVVVLFAGGVILMSLQSNSGFDSKTWQAQKGVERDNARAGMLGELERKYLRVGMARTEVQRLLGKPDFSEPARDVYELGRSPVGVDFESYVIEYDGAEAVTRFQLTRG